LFESVFLLSATSFHRFSRQFYTHITKNIHRSKRHLDIPKNGTTLKLAGVSVSAVDGVGQKRLMVSEVGQW